MLSLVTRKSVTQLKCWTFFSLSSQYSRKFTRMSERDSFGGIALTIVFLGAILFDNRFGHQGNHFAPIRMNEGGAQHLMRIGDRPVTVMLFETRRTMNLCGGKIPGAIEG